MMSHVGGLSHRCGGTDGSPIRLMLRTKMHKKSSKPQIKNDRLMGSTARHPGEPPGPVYGERSPEAARPARREADAQAALTHTHAQALHHRKRQQQQQRQPRQQEQQQKRREAWRSRPAPAETKDHTKGEANGQTIHRIALVGGLSHRRVIRRIYLTSGQKGKNSVGRAKAFRHVGGPSHRWRMPEARTRKVRLRKDREEAKSRLTHSRTHCRTHRSTSTEES